MNLEGMSKKQLLDLTIELSSSLKEEDLHDPEIYSLVSQLMDILDDSGYKLPQELIDQLSQITDKKQMFMQAVQAIGAQDESQLETIAHSLKSAGLLKAEDIGNDLYKASPIDLTNSHILMFPVKINGSHTSEHPDIPPYHVTLKWLGADKPIEHNQVSSLAQKYQLHPPKIKSVEPLTWPSPRGDIHVLALHGDHDNLHEAHNELSAGNKSLHPYTPHITVSKELHDRVKNENLTPEQLGIEVGPLEYHIGNQKIKEFHAAPQVQEQYTQPTKPTKLEASELASKAKQILKKSEHPIHSNLQNRKQYRNALRVADQHEELFKYEAPKSRQIQIANEYAASKGLTLNHNLPVHKVNIERAKRISNAYENMAHEPQKPEVKQAYSDLINETRDQYRLLKKRGVKISRIEDGAENPYKRGSEDLRNDIHNNNHVHFFPTESAFGSDDGTDVSDHPMLQDSGEVHNGKKLLNNDLFRIVHDYFGHAKAGHTFGQHGEDNAWKSHKQMYSPSAQRALTAETRGQNSWVNHGPFGEQNRRDPQNTVYAAQKAGLLPDWAMDHEDEVPAQHEKLAASELARASLGKSELINKAKKVLKKHGE